MLFDQVPYNERWEGGGREGGGRGEGKGGGEGPERRGEIK